MVRKAQRQGNNSVMHAASVFSSSAKDIPVPKGFDDNREGFIELWHSFAQARTSADWLPSDLHFLARVVDLELDIREQTRLCRKEGYLTPNLRGTANVTNPRNRVIEQLIKIQMSIVSKLSITAGLSHPEAIRRGAKKAMEGESVREKGDNLLAQ